MRKIIFKISVLLSLSIFAFNASAQTTVATMARGFIPHLDSILKFVGAACFIMAFILAAKGLFALKDLGDKSSGKNKGLKALTYFLAAGILSSIMVMIVVSVNTVGLNPKGGGIHSGGAAVSGSKY